MDFKEIDILHNSFNLAKDSLCSVGSFIIESERERVMFPQDLIIRQQPVSNDPPTSAMNSDSGTNLLDPHLSILHYLENEDKGEAFQSTPQEESIDTRISESWHNVEESEVLDENTRPQSVLSTATPNRNVSTAVSNTDILSSTDTSSVEDSPRELSPTLHTSVNHASVSSMLSQPCTSMYSTSFPSVTNTLSQHGSDETNTNTVTNSFSSSSNSFIMPKLSFKTGNKTFSFSSQCESGFEAEEDYMSKKNQILILGRHGLKFFKSIPFTYQSYFQLPTGHDSQDYQNFNGLLVIVKELREFISLLNRISKLDGGGPPLIVLYDNDQRIQVKNVVRSFLRNELISLYYPPIDMDSGEELGNLLKHVKRSLTTSGAKETSSSLHVSSTSVPGSASTSATFTTSSKRLSKSGTSIHERKRKNKKTSRAYRKRNRSGKGDPKGHKPKAWCHYIFNKWVMVGVSVTAGLGTAYYFSHTDKDLALYMKSMVNKLRQAPLIRTLIKFCKTQETEIIEPPQYPISKVPLNRPINFWTKVIKYPFEKINTLVKDAIISATTSHGFSFGRLNMLNNWNIDDPNNFITLSYITV